jgi:hypothetical protein
MTNTPTPRDLDPKFKDATAPEEGKDNTPTPVEAKQETSQEQLKRLQSTEIAKDPTEGQIVYRQPYVDSAGNVGEKVHGPMPVSQWAKYSQENGL